MTIVKHFQKMLLLRQRQRPNAPAIQHQHADAGMLPKQFPVVFVAARNGEIVGQMGQSFVADRNSFETRLVREHASDDALARSGGRSRPCARR